MRHGTKCILRYISSKVSKEAIDLTIIGRRVIEFIGCDNRAMFQAARDKLGEEIDVADQLLQDRNVE